MTRTKSIAATLKGGEGGTFTAVASTASKDRDGEVIDAGAFNPLPATVPVHMGHPTTPGAGASTLIGRARPFYQGGQLMIEGWFATTDAAQVARALVAEGILDAVSVMFIGARRESRQGVVHITDGELISVDLVSIPSNRDALVVSARALNLAGVCALGRAVAVTTAEARAAAAVALAVAEVAEGRALLRGSRSKSVTHDGFTRDGFTPSTANRSK